MKPWKLIPLSAALVLTLGAPIVRAAEDFTVSIENDEVIVTRMDGSQLTLAPEFTVIYAVKDPKKQIRYGEHGYKLAEHEEIGVKYHVPVWGKAEQLKRDVDEHVMDGFDPEIDRALDKGQTANMFLAGEMTRLVADQVLLEDNRVEWTFPSNDFIDLKATITVVAGDSFPSISYEFNALKDGFYAVGYSGAPACDVAETDEIWQAMIWSEKRFPTGPYVTESFHSQLPGTFVAKAGAVHGLIGAPEFLPFMPMPNEKNSQFGMLVRSPAGLAQSSIYSPVLGAKGSKMNKGDVHEFKAYVYLKKGTINEAYEEGARRIYGFSDIRRNTTVSLNTTFENLVDFCMSKYGEYNEQLRGSNYSTDVPGAVKNISGLHPLSIAVVTDNPEIYWKRALPMLEYGLTRERFLFATNPDIKRDGTSANLAGPGVPMNDLSTTYTYSGERMPHFLDVAKTIYEKPVNRSLNLDAMLYGDRWQNAMYLFRSTGDPEFREQAIEKADAYLAERVNKKQTSHNDKHSRGMFFWTSYTNQFMELYLMYLTTGEQRYLDAAHQGARDYTRFCWVSPKIPDGEVVVNAGGEVPRYRASKKFVTMKLPEESVDAWRVSEHGLTPESSPTCNGHRGIFLAHQAPFMMRIAAETDDQFLHDLARSAVIGRYESFPGYHLNAERTTAFEKYDFARRPFLELNGHTSMHFNHVWPQTAMVLDYLMAEAFYYSERKIDMNPEYAEGYAYCRSLIYGANKGRFYEDEGVIPYLPKGLLRIEALQLNYVAARGNDKLYTAFINQSEELVRTTVQFDLEKAGLESGKVYPCQIWKDNEAQAAGNIVDGRMELEISPKGIIALAIKGAAPKTKFQDKFYSESPAWSRDHSSLGFHDDHAVIFNMGEGLVSAYFMTAANNDVFQKVAVRYQFDGGEPKTLTRSGYPYEFTIEVPDSVKNISYSIEGVRPDGTIEKSKPGELKKF